MAENDKSKTQILKELNEIKQEYSLLIKVFDSVNDGITIVQDEVVKYANIKLGEFTGYPKEETINVPYIKFVHPDEVPRVIEIHKRRLVGEKVPSRYESALIHRDGAKIYVEFTVTEILYKGKPAVLAIIRDITQRKKAEEKIREKAVFFESLFENSPEAVAFLDQTGRVIKVNKEFEKMFGYKIDEMKGKLLDNFVARGEFLKEAEQIRKKTDKGEKIELEAIRFKKDGTSFDVHITESPIKYDNQIIGKYVIYRDISARKKAERKLKESEKRYRELVELADAGIIIDDKYGHVVYANKRLAQILGYKSNKELKKLTIYDYIHPDDREKVLNYHQRRVLGKRAPQLYEFKGIRKDGKTIYLEVAVSPIMTEKEIIGTRSYIWDITDRKKMEKTLKKALNEKSIMLQEIHHRVKNNMQIIISLMRIQARKAKHKETKDCLQALQNRVYSMSLIHDHFYQKPDLDKINIASYVKQLIDHLFFIYNKKQKQIQVNLDLEEIYLDLNKAIPFGMLVNEVISNVLKHAFPGRKKGELSLRIYRDGNKNIRLLVNDTGVGLPKEVDIENPSTMGLQLIRDLTKQLRGEIQIKSNGETQIKVIFPEKY
jgi:PAS domain S-box-containing protein